MSTFLRLNSTQISAPSLVSLERLPEPIQLSDTPCLIKPFVSLAPLTSFRVGGSAEWFVAPRTVDDLRKSVEWAQARDLPITVLGAGSNLLISDRGLSGLVISTRYLRHSHFDEATAQITATTGEPIVRLAWQAADRGWSGLEWSVGIPGTVGGAVVMNAGAHDGCAADVLLNAQVLTPMGDIQVLSQPDLQYQYRSSVLQRDRRIVLQATFQLKPGVDPHVVNATTKAYLERRHTTQPYHLPSCGSVFRNPNPYKAGQLIEQAGLKGYQIGGAQVSEMHANFIVNVGGATANDIFQLIRYVQAQVRDRWAIDLEPEVKMLGEFVND
ncbi:UDP-N-acetylmuramate dehydrogenase [Oscillatoria sp. FACHB-1407]|uniref:UDP-N-acetylmuramate dehydrogenase n=1 Tax=Oscillatoria sp. FACHB-1407 TaxID=2692847 RepID=UPI0016881E3D|nr:UDP-N-acetylmuramate dehydrogenase [Oscillatoria sp. FACHB-1407]MBD2460835.1 UDP-N-acetylmuramate dehydrogenase [Oscillatoria sp. FACHB-1407]